jgi:hypothetical protein
MPSGSAIADGANRAALGEVGERGQEHQHEDHRKVLDHQPADRDTAALGVEQAPLLQVAQHHDGAGDRQRHAEHEPAPATQPSSTRERAERVAITICTIAPGTAMARTDSSSCSENCRPTPNISRMMPISARSLASAGRQRSPA